MVPVMTLLVVLAAAMYGGLPTVLRVVEDATGMAELFVPIIA